MPSLPYPPRIYIAGPMTGLPDFNYPAFFGAADQLREAGYDPINPARQRPDVPHQGARWIDYMRLSLRDVADCDGIALLPDWENSRGASLEVHIARSLDLPVRAVEAWLEEAA